jgi:hypothetical protein
MLRGSFASKLVCMDVKWTLILAHGATKEQTVEPSR